MLIALEFNPKTTKQGSLIALLLKAFSMLENLEEVHRKTGKIKLPCMKVSCQTTSGLSPPLSPSFSPVLHRESEHCPSLKGRRLYRLRPSTCVSTSQDITMSIAGS